MAQRCNHQISNYMGVQYTTVCNMFPTLLFLYLCMFDFRFTVCGETTRIEKTVRILMNHQCHPYHQVHSVFTASGFVTVLSDIAAKMRGEASRAPTFCSRKLEVWSVWIIVIFSYHLFLGPFSKVNSGSIVLDRSSSIESSISTQQSQVSLNVRLYIVRLRKKSGKLTLNQAVAKVVRIPCRQSLLFMEDLGADCVVALMILALSLASKGGKRFQTNRPHREILAIKKKFLP